MLEGWRRQIGLGERRVGLGEAERGGVGLSVTQSFAVSTCEMARGEEVGEAVGAEPSQAMRLVLKAPVMVAISWMALTR